MTSTQGYISPGPYPSVNMFGQTIGRNMHASNFRTPTTQPEQIDKYFRGINLDALNTEETTERSFFDFEPTSGTQSPSQLQYSTPGAPGLPWGNEINFHPMSPPDSVEYSPKGWQYPGLQRFPSSNIVKSIDPNNTKTQYGQVTPPDDTINDESLLEQYQSQPLQSLDAGKKRKRNSANGNEPTSSKRSRKYASRVSQSNEPNKPEDVKRSKFLERNRVAASKCRQKKKEWTQNLENRARELQKTNASLRMVIDSTRQEILFLKSEALKHSSCGCREIQDYMQSDLNTLPSDGMVFKREQSPIESMPPSRMGSPSVHSQNGLDEFDPHSPVADQANPGMEHDETSLEALLTSSIIQGASDEKIASPLGE